VSLRLSILSASKPICRLLRLVLHSDDLFEKMLIDSVLVPYGQHGVGQGPQVPLRASLPPSITLPTYPSVAAYSSLSDSVTTPDVHPTIDIPIEQLSSGQTPTLLASSTGGPSNVSSTPMKGQKPAIAAAGTFFGLFTVSQIYQHVLFPNLTLASKQAEEKKWVASSHSWLDRKACNWFGLCGLSHPNEAGWSTSETRISSAQVDEEGKVDLDQFWKDVNAKPDDWSKEERRLREVPNYVLEHAPYIHLYSGEEYWPGDISEHLIHTTPHLNYTPLQASSDHPNLTNLNELNRWGFHVFLQSDDNVEDHPDWLAGESNIPNVPDDSDPDRSGAVPIPTKSPQGDNFVHEDQDFWQSELRHRKGRHEVRRLTGKKVVGGRSEAPAVLIVVEKEDGVVDAFWFFFYSYNLGNTVFNVRFGNHVGDWEHTVVRFQHGKPKAVFFSEHSFGEAYHWDAVEKIGNRVSISIFARVLSLMLLSLWAILLLERTPCMAHQACTPTSCLVVYSTMSQIEGLSGIRR
jgi:hypothetical protein